MTLDEFLAVEVMGYIKESRHDYRGFHGEIYKREGLSPILCSSWQPIKNISHAFQCLGKFEEWEVFKDHVYFVRINNFVETKFQGEAQDENLLLAISLACARARGYDESD